MSPDGRRAIAVEREAIQLVVDAIAAHRDEVRGANGDPWALGAAGGALHSFYGGVENILKAIARGYGETLPSGNAWHVDLLKQMTIETPLRRAVLSPEVTAMLQPFLGFRHVYRSQYAMRLDAARLGDLMDDLPDVWRAFQTALDQLDDGGPPGGSPKQ